MSHRLNLNTLVTAEYFMPLAFRRNSHQLHIAQYKDKNCSHPRPFSTSGISHQGRNYSCTSTSKIQVALSDDSTKQEKILMVEKDFLRPVKTKMAEGIQALLLQLRELQYITRYGDYLKILPNQVSKHSRCINHPGNTFYLYTRTFQLLTIGNIRFRAARRLSVLVGYRQHPHEREVRL